jgi:hypothetical protein
MLRPAKILVDSSKTIARATDPKSAGSKSRAKMMLPIKLSGRITIAKPPIIMLFLAVVSFKSLMFHLCLIELIQQQSRMVIIKDYNLAFVIIPVVMLMEIYIKKNYIKHLLGKFISSVGV